MSQVGPIDPIAPIFWDHACSISGVKVALLDTLHKGGLGDIQISFLLSQVYMKSLVTIRKCQRIKIYIENYFEIS